MTIILQSAPAGCGVKIAKLAKHWVRIPLGSARGGGKPIRTSVRPPARQRHPCYRRINVEPCFSWPKTRSKQRRAVTAEEHAKIIASEKSPEKRPPTTNSLTKRRAQTRETVCDGVSPVSRSRPTQPGGQPATAPVGGAVLRATTGPLQNPRLQLSGIRPHPATLVTGYEPCETACQNRLHKRDSRGFQVGFCKAASNLAPNRVCGSVWNREPLRRNVLPLSGSLKRHCKSAPCPSFRST